jgi:hypothetical protein
MPAFFRMLEGKMLHKPLVSIWLSPVHAVVLMCTSR